MSPSVKNMGMKKRRRFQRRGQRPTGQETIGVKREQEHVCSRCKQRGHNKRTCAP